MENFLYHNNNQRFTKNFAFCHQAKDKVAFWLCKPPQAKPKTQGKPSRLVLNPAGAKNNRKNGTG
jgi:hypothetical protein